MCGRQIGLVAGNDIPPFVHRTPLLPFNQCQARSAQWFNCERPCMQSRTTSIHTTITTIRDCFRCYKLYMYLHMVHFVIKYKRLMHLYMLLISLSFQQNSIHQYAKHSKEGTKH